MTDQPANPYADLQALANKGDGQTRTLRRFDTARWSYPGAPCEGTNIRVPSKSAGDLRVRAALAAGAWVVSETDAAGRPIAIVPADAAPAVVATHLDHGTVGVMTEGVIHPDGTFSTTSRPVVPTEAE